MVNQELEEKYNEDDYTSVPIGMCRKPENATCPSFENGNCNLLGYPKSKGPVKVGSIGNRCCYFIHPNEYLIECPKSPADLSEDLETRKKQLGKLAKKAFKRYCAETGPCYPSQIKQTYMEGFEDALCWLGFLPIHKLPKGVQEPEDEDEINVEFESIPCKLGGIWW